MRANLRDKAIKYTRSSPEAFEIESSWGARTDFLLKPVLASLAGGVSAASVSAFFPDGWTVLGVTAVVTEKIISSGSQTTFNIRKNGVVIYAKTLSTLVLAKGTLCEMKDIANFTAPVHLVADETLDFTVSGGSGDTTAGKIRVFLHAVRCVAPVA